MIILGPYKGFKGEYDYYKEFNMYFGWIYGTQEPVNFQGNTAMEAHDDFKDSIDDYLERYESTRLKETNKILGFDVDGWRVMFGISVGMFLGYTAPTWWLMPLAVGIALTILLVCSNFRVTRR